MLQRGMSIRNHAREENLLLDAHGNSCSRITPPDHKVQGTDSKTSMFTVFLIPPGSRRRFRPRCAWSPNHFSL